MSYIDDRFSFLQETYQFSGGENITVQPTVIAPIYDPTVSYAQGSLVMHNGRLYRKTSNQTSPEPWNPEHWTQTDVIDADSEKLEQAMGSVSDWVDVAYTTKNGTLYGITITQIDANKYSMYGTATAARYFNLYNGAFNALSASANITKRFPAGTYKFTWVFTNLLEGRAVRAIKTTCGGSDSLLLENGATVEVPFEFNISFSLSNNYNAGTSESPSTFEFHAERLTVIDSGKLESTRDTTDRALEITQLCEAYGVCRLGKGDFYVSGIEMLRGTSIIGSGADSRIILLPSVTEGQAIKLTTNCTVQNCTVLGGIAEYTPDGNVGTRHGISFVYIDENNPRECVIDNVRIANFEGNGLNFDATGTASDRNCIVSNCIVENCNVGLYTYRSEYNKIADSTFRVNYYGAVNNGGNNTISNCQFTKNTVNYKMGGSGEYQNDSHGSVVNCTFNHAGDNTGVSIDIQNMTSGQVFEGCQVFYGAINITTSIGIVFNTCNFGTGTPITVTGGHLVQFNSCTFKNATETTVTITNNTKTYFNDCYLRDGTEFQPTGSKSSNTADSAASLGSIKPLQNAISTRNLLDVAGGAMKKATMPTFTYGHTIVMEGSSAGDIDTTATANAAACHEYVPVSKGNHVWFGLFGQTLDVAYYTKSGSTYTCLLTRSLNNTFYVFEADGYARFCLRSEVAAYDLDFCVQQIKLMQSFKDAEAVAYAAFATDTVTGAIASFPDGADNIPVKDLTLDIEPVQDLHGQASPYPAGGGVNKLPSGGVFDSTNNGIRFTCDGNGKYTITGTATAEAYYDFTIDEVTFPSTTYIHFFNNAATYSVAFVFFNGNTQVAAPTPNTSANRIVQSQNLAGQTVNKLRLYVANGYTANMTLSPMVCTDDTVKPFSPYSNICPISGHTGVNVTWTGKNLCDGTFQNGYYNNNGAWLLDPAHRTAIVKVNPQTKYTSSFYTLNGTRKNHLVSIQFDAYMNAIDGTWTTNEIITTSANAVWVAFRAFAAELSYIADDDFAYQVEEGENYTALSAYGTTIPITFPSEAGTVYGGTLDVTTGVLTVDRAAVDMGSLSWTRYTTTSYNRYIFYADVSGAKALSDLRCSILKPWVGSPDGATIANHGDCIIGRQSTSGGTRLIATYDAVTSANAFTTAVTGQTVVYELATSTTYQLTPQELKTLLGTNNIWHDANGNTTCLYRADTKAYIAKMIANALNA